MKKEEKGITLLSLIIVILVLIIIVALTITAIFKLKNTNNTTVKSNPQKSNEVLNSNNNFYKETYKDTDYYISNGEYKGEYDLQILYFNEHRLEDFEANEVMSYSQYRNYCNKWKLEQKYNMTDSKYIVFAHEEGGAASVKAIFSGIEINNKTATLYIWDEGSGLVADTSAYVIIIPTKLDIKNVEVQALYSKEQYNKMVGNNPLEGYSYNAENNKKMASQCYINTSDSKLNDIINKMLDSMVAKHTIQVDTDKEIWLNQPSTIKLDLIESIEEYSSGGKISSYTTYTNENNTTYFTDGSNMSSGRTRDSALYELFLRGQLTFLEAPETYDYKINEEDIYYVIEAKKQIEDKQIEETYFINKETNLLEKTIVKFFKYNPTSIYTYTDEVIQIPKNLYKNSRRIMEVYKPIIYLYPTEDLEVSVKLLKDKNLTCSYPKYKDEWKVLAQTNGNLKDLATNRQLYSLYYESKNDVEFKVENDGFVVKGEDTIKFLEEKLAILGLTEREAEEFIVYWLPKLEANKYNYVRFATLEEINENMPLEISPTPDTLIRVLMTFKELEKPIEVQEQKLETIDRTGFIAVEWGGTEIK